MSIAPRFLFPAVAGLALALPACQSAPVEPAASKEPAAPPAPATASALAPAKRAFGKPIEAASTTSLATLMKEPAKFDGQVIRTEGKIAAVCKKAGCWMDLADSSGTAHVKMAGHSFFIPRDAAGKQAVVQAKVIAVPEADTCGSKDDCRGPDQAVAVAKVELEATGVELVD